MIVTCPGCTANYRVRNEAVPAGGAKMRCPKCGTMFLALAPEDEDSDDVAPAPGKGNAPEPVAGLFEPSLVETGSVPKSMAADVRAATAAASAGTSPPRGTPPSPAPSSSFPAPPGTAGGFSRHTASTSLEQLTGGLGGPGPAPSAAPSASPFRGAGAPVPAGPLPSGGDLFPGARPGGPGPDPFERASGQDPFGQDPFGQGPKSVAITDDEDDPFARLDLEEARAAASPAAPSLQIRDDEPSARIRPAPAGPREAPRRPPEAKKPPPPAPAPPPAEPSVAAGVFSWVLVVLGVVVAAGGLTFSAWTARVVDLDGALMPVFERNFDVSPPRSSIGRDEPRPAALLERVEAAKQRGDLVDEAVQLRRALQVAPSPDAVLEGRLQELVKQLRHPGILD